MNVKQSEALTNYQVFSAARGIRLLSCMLMSCTSIICLLIAVSPCFSGETILWRIGIVDDSFNEFADFQSTDTESFAIPDNWQTRALWTDISKGVARDRNRVLELSYSLPVVPEHGALLWFKLMDAHRLGAQAAVYSNGLMAGLIQLWGTSGVTDAPYKWKKTYRLYIPAEMLYQGTNILRFESLRPLNCGAESDSKSWWTWDYVALVQPDSAVSEPVHGKLTWMGTTMKHGEHKWTINERTLQYADLALHWLGIAYSGNTIRADFWSDISYLQPEQLAYLQKLRDLNMTVNADHINTGHSTYFNDDGTLSGSGQSKLDTFFDKYDTLFQWYEVDNEPGLFNRLKSRNIGIAQYVNSIKPDHVVTAAPGWAFWGGTWARDPVQRKEVEDLCGALNGHAYGISYRDAQGGSFIENLETYDGVVDGWPKEYITTEIGANDDHTDDASGGSLQPHATVFDRILRVHVAVADRFNQHAAHFGKYSLFAAPDFETMDDLAAYNAHAGEESRVAAFRRNACAYATHGTPVPFQTENSSELQNKPVYVRAVNTAGLAPLPGSGGTADKVIVSFVNFGSDSATVRATFTMPVYGIWGGDRFGPGETYKTSHSTVTDMQAQPQLALEENLGKGETVQYYLKCLQATSSGPSQTGVAAVQNTAFLASTYSRQILSLRDHLAVPGYARVVRVYDLQGKLLWSKRPGMGRSEDKKISAPDHCKRRMAVIEYVR
ncbi:MAG: hypothetical protein GF401_15550 [Chitinivibrionales bacterium]|nr:hypothetical protein [Chitinivibrionales bacterium]